MSLATILRSGVALTDSITDSLQVAVTHEAWSGLSSYGAPTFATGVSRDAIVDYGPRLIRDASGQEVPVRATVMILRPIAANGASGRREPIDPRDRFTLPDGTTGPILEVRQGVVDPSTSRPYCYEVALG